MDKGGRLCIPGNNLGKKLLKKTYDEKWIGYPSEEQLWHYYLSPIIG